MPIPPRCWRRPGFFKILEMLTIGRQSRQRVVTTEWPNSILVPPFAAELFDKVVDKGEKPLPFRLYFRER